ncbi:MAG: DNA mismatch repair protein MutS, partial [Gammaproteobacteria bacterium]
MGGTPDITEDEKALFRRAVGEVRPIRQDSVPPFRRRPAAVPVQTRADERAVMAALATGEDAPEDAETGEEIHFQRPGIQDRVFQKLRRGQFSVEAELDLHGLTITAARDALSRFLSDLR